MIIGGDDLGFGIVFITILAFIIISGILRYIKNENSPVIATKAKLVNKRRDTHTHTDANGAMHMDETLYLAFQLDTGSTMELAVNGRVYRNVPENEWGTLTFQGTRFIKYEYAGGTVER